MNNINIAINVDLIKPGFKKGDNLNTNRTHPLQMHCEKYKEKKNCFYIVREENI